MRALNELLAPWGVAFGDTVLEGEFSLGSGAGGGSEQVGVPHEVHFASGAGLVRFPADGTIITPETLKVRSLDDL